MYFKIILLVFSCVLRFAYLDCFQGFNQCGQIYVYSDGSKYAKDVVDMFTAYDIKFKIIDSIAQDDEHLYIIFDLFNLDERTLPKYYIAYQTLDLTEQPLTDMYAQKLHKAIAVWDYSRENIARYRASLSHYYFLPKDYEFAAAVLLACLLPVDTLYAYKDLVKISNEITNTPFSPIASHLPIIFFYSFLQDPKLIVEAGIEFAISTKAFSKVLKYKPDAHLFGVDIQILDAARTAYAALSNVTLLHMDDRNFYDYYMDTNYKNQKIDIVFIDTSHKYQHTLQEIEQFSKLLADNGILIFHDSNVTPDNNGTSFTCLNGDRVNASWNPRGVPQAIKEYFDFDFDEYEYLDRIFHNHSAMWHLIHYPFCNGLTIIRLLGKDLL